MGAWSKSGSPSRRHPRLPSPIYKNKGWIGWDDWLRDDGRARRTSWRVAALRRFVASLSDHLASLTPAELYVLFQQNGLLASHGGPGASPAPSSAAPSPPLSWRSSLRVSRRRWTTSWRPRPRGTPPTPPGQRSELDPDADLDRVVVDGGAEATPDLPLVETAEALAALGRVVSSADAEAVEFLIASAVRKMWTHAFRDEAKAVAQAEAAPDNEYAQRAAQQFLDEYRAATALAIPAGYAFRGLDGQLSEPHLMQRLIASQVQTRRRVGNWSGTGAGKTLAAVLASRAVDAGLTVVTCPTAWSTSGRGRSATPSPTAWSPSRPGTRPPPTRPPASRPAPTGIWS